MQNTDQKTIIAKLGITFFTDFLQLIFILVIESVQLSILNYLLITLLISFWID